VKTTCDMMGPSGSPSAPSLGRAATPAAPSGMPLRMAIVGCGAIARAMHIPACLAVEEVSLSALVDSDRSRVDAAATDFRVTVAATELSAVAGQVDAVVLCTPPHTHAGLAQGAFRLGLHVLCEKPLGNSARECDAMIDAGRDAGRVLAVAHIFRHWPSRSAVRDVIRTGEFGAVQSVDVAQGNPYSWETATGYNMRRELVPGGVLFDAGIHPLDTLLWWLGDPASFDYEDDALGGLESNARLRLGFAGGVKAVLRLSRTCRLANEFRVGCEHGTLVLSAYNPWQYEVRRAGAVEVRSCLPAAVDHCYCEQAQVRDFAQSIRAGRAPRVTGEEAARAIHLIEDCYQARRVRPLPDMAPIPGLTW